MNQKKSRYNRVFLLLFILLSVVIGVLYYENNAYGPLVEAYEAKFAEQTGEINALNDAREKAVIAQQKCQQNAQSDSFCRQLSDAIDDSQKVKALKHLPEDASRKAVKAARSELRENIDKIVTTREKLIRLTADVIESQVGQIRKSYLDARTKLENSIKALREMITTLDGQVPDSQLILDATADADAAQKVLDQAAASSEINNLSSADFSAQSEKVARLTSQSEEFVKLSDNLKQRISQLEEAHAQWQAAQSTTQTNPEIAEQYIAPSTGLVNPQTTTPELNPAPVTPNSGSASTVEPAPSPEPNPVPEPAPAPETEIGSDAGSDASANPQM